MCGLYELVPARSIEAESLGLRYESLPVSSRSLCLPPARIHFCEFVARLSLEKSEFVSTVPRKMALYLWICLESGPLSREVISLLVHSGICKEKSRV